MTESAISSGRATAIGIGEPELVGELTQNRPRADERDRPALGRGTIGAREALTGAKDSSVRRAGRICHDAWQTPSTRVDRLVAQWASQRPDLDLAVMASVARLLRVAGRSAPSSRRAPPARAST